MAALPPSSSTANASIAAAPAPPLFRFLPSEVAVMEACLQKLPAGVLVPSLPVVQALAASFSAKAERAGKQVVVHPRQVWKWFQNRRYTRPPRIIRGAHHGSSSSSFPGRKPMQGLNLEFEAKSAHDGAWYDVVAFLAERRLESGHLEVQVRFSGFEAEGDEWINVRKCVRQRSLICGAKECFAVLSGDLILCFQETKKHALYFDAHVLDVQRRRHDVRGCRCRFLVRYDHDSSEEIVPLIKVCRLQDTDYRLRILHAARVEAPTDVHTPPKEDVKDDDELQVVTAKLKEL